MQTKYKEDLIIKVAAKYKKTFSNLIKEGKESHLTQLLKDE